ncbi:cation:proton antiporter, partial [Streptomyces caatingaensis]
VMPRLPEVTGIADRTDAVVSWLLLPMFFATVGLRTNIGLMEGGSDWLLCALLVVLAMVGKLIGTSLPAQLLGVDRRRATQLGVMMSCRGLTELVVLDVGLQLGLIPPRLFAMLVVMTLVTTMITAPLLRRLRIGGEVDGLSPADSASSPETRAAGWL